MKKIALIGYSGHAFVVCDIFESNGRRVDAYFDAKEKADNPFGLLFLSSETAFDALRKLENRDIFVAIGDNKIRRRVTEFLLKNNFPKPVVGIHATAFFSEKATIDAGSMVGPKAVVNAATQIGVGCIINSAAVIEHECKIGDFAHIAPGAVLCGNVRVGDHSFIGAGSVVKQGISIGNNVVVGAGSVVVKNLPDNVLAFGNPAKIEHI